jgi:hypothetical protein
VVMSMVAPLPLLLWVGLVGVDLLYVSSKSVKWWGMEADV